MIARLGAALSRVGERYLPDPFVLALGITVLVGGASLKTLSGTEVVGAWMDGFASPPLLGFALQMCLVLVTGHALALSPPVQRMVRRLARIPKNTAQATALVAFISCAAAVVHWGLGAIVGAFLAREVGRHAKSVGTRIHYPLLGAAAYTGMAVWHGGLSGSAPLKVAEAGHFAEGVGGVIPVSGTVFGTLNFVVTGGLVIGLPLLMMLLVPKDPADFQLPSHLPDDVEQRDASTSRDKWTAYLAGVGGLVAVVSAWMSGESAFDVNLMNFLFLFTGILLQGSIKHYVAAIADGARGAGAIILQFPFYFGILGMMKAAGLVSALSAWMVSTTSAATFAPLVFLSAGLT
ncbi:MAG: short-chain fatty acids transporter, partial [Polyangiales bacterium]